MKSSDSMGEKVSLGAIILATAVCWVVGTLFALFAYRYSRFISLFWAFLFFGAACFLTRVVLRALKRPIDSEIKDNARGTSTKQ
jgi:type VI protein secretion system component VasK